MKVYENIQTWIINILLMITGVGIFTLYVVGIVMAFIAVAK